MGNIFSSLHKKFDSIPCRNFKEAKDIIKAIKEIEDEVSVKIHRLIKMHLIELNFESPFLIV